jgi:hypothetical protein
MVIATPKATEQKPTTASSRLTTVATQMACVVTLVATRRTCCKAKSWSEGISRWSDIARDVCEDISRITTRIFWCLRRNRSRGKTGIDSTGGAHHRRDLLLGDLSGGMRRCLMALVATRSTSSKAKTWACGMPNEGTTPFEMKGSSETHVYECMRFAFRGTSSMQVLHSQQQRVGVGGALLPVAGRGGGRDRSASCSWPSRNMNQQRGRRYPVSRELSVLSSSHCGLDGRGRRLQQSFAKTGE